eukprot:TRINITY_DN66459_c0_g1_i1.p1 TRINITY_DN66459_c0_g1~~TRINITY_DN66459_c0_g1_i1.p1  ORF type:complete len:215 (-),score=31.03 TRINITY_DN66459_c0_g1_i1:76-720(-)
MVYEDDFERVRAESAKCCAAFCFDVGCSANPCGPGLVGNVTACCFSLGVKTDTEVCCREDKGMISVFPKCCCCVPAASTRNISVVCLDQICCGSGPLGESENVEDSDLSYMEDVFWCCYCLIAGFGCTKQVLPMASGVMNVCCLEAKLSTNPCCDEGLGCCGIHLKTCCCVADAQLPPTRSVGLTCCCIECCGSEAREPDVGEPVGSSSEDSVE